MVLCSVAVAFPPHCCHLGLNGLHPSLAPRSLTFDLPAQRSLLSVPPLSVWCKMASPAKERPPLDLPDEVIALLLRHVNRLSFFRISTLKSCALLSHAFRGPAQTHLFSTIRFDISRTSRFRVFQTFAKVLLENRGLGRYVRELELRSDSSDLYEIHIRAFNAFRTMTSLNKFAFICGIQREERPRPASMTEFDNLQSENDIVGWDRFSLSVQSNLMFLFSLPSLRTLELGGVRSFPASYLLSFMRLDYLILDSQLTLDNSIAAGQATSLQILSSIKLKSLALREVGDGVATALASMLAYKPDGLKRLELSPVRFAGVDKFSTAVWSLMRLGGRALEEFEWEGVAARRASFAHLQPSANPSLFNSSRLQTNRPLNYSHNASAPHCCDHVSTLVRRTPSPHGPPRPPPTAYPSGRCSRSSDD